MFMPLNKIGRANKRLVILFANQHPEYIKAVKQLLAHVRFPEFSRELNFNTRPCGTIKTTKSGQKSFTFTPKTIEALERFLTFDDKTEILTALIIHPSFSQILLSLKTDASRRERSRSNLAILPPSPTRVELSERWDTTSTQFFSSRSPLAPALTDPAGTTPRML